MFRWKLTWPVSGDSFWRIRLNKVDLPAPLGPTNPMRSSRFTCSVTPSNNVRPAKDLLTSEMVNIQKRKACGRLVNQASGFIGQFQPAGTRRSGVFLPHAGASTPIPQSEEHSP